VSGPDAFEALPVQSAQELAAAEPEILDRIATTANGASLFLIHPFRLLADVGVVLSDECREELLQLHPELSGLSDGPYDALRAGAEPAHTVRLSGLFRKDGG
jgi:hypothetical protein